MSDNGENRITSLVETPDDVLGDPSWTLMVLNHTRPQGSIMEEFELREAVRVRSDLTPRRAKEILFRLHQGRYNASTGQPLKWESHLNPGLVKVDRWARSVLGQAAATKLMAIWGFDKKPDPVAEEERILAEVEKDVAAASERG